MTLAQAIINTVVGGLLGWYIAYAQSNRRRISVLSERVDIIERRIKLTKDRP